MYIKEVMRESDHVTWDNSLLFQECHGIFYLLLGISAQGHTGPSFYVPSDGWSKCDKSLTQGDYAKTWAGIESRTLLSKG